MAVLIDGPGFQIRSVEGHSLSEIIPVYQQCEDFLALGPAPRASEKMVQDDLHLSSDMGGIFCGIYVDGVMVGVVDFVLSGYDGEADSAYLSLLMIAQRHRRTGIGRAVVGAVEAEIIKNPAIKAIHAGVQVNNPSAIAFWRSLGYAVVSEPRRMPDTTVVVALRKDAAQVNPRP